jgi:hypothetical protein
VITINEIAKKGIFPFLGLFLLVLYVSVGYLSLGYDDEFANIDWITRYGFGVINIAQAHDINPPGSYFMDWILYTIFARWELVRSFISLITAASIIYAIVSIKNRKGTFAGIILFILLGLNPAILLWCTSVRWYAFFVPVLIWLSIVPKHQGWQYWAKCFGGLLILGYLGYAVFIVSIPIWILYWMENKGNIKDKIKNCILFGFLFLILYSYQFWIFVTVHIHGKEDQIFSLLKCLIGFYAGQISNQGVFPVSLPGLLASMATFGMLITIFYSNVLVNLKNKYFASYSIASILTIITGIAGKFRNLVVISPWQAFWMSTAKVEAPQKKLFLFFLSFLTISNLWGDFNIITRQNTSKNDYNLPVKQILTDLSMEDIKCKKDMVILCHTRTLSWNLEKAGYRVLDPDSYRLLTKQELRSKHNCVVVLKTWPGRIAPKKYQSMYDEIKLLKYTSSTNSKYGRDDFYLLKKKLDDRFPEYSVEVTKYYNVENIDTLSLWKPKIKLR